MTNKKTEKKEKKRRQTREKWTIECTVGCIFQYKIVILLLFFDYLLKMHSSGHPQQMQFRYNEWAEATALGTGTLGQCPHKRCIIAAITPNINSIHSFVSIWNTKAISSRWRTACETENRFFSFVRCCCCCFFIKLI